MTFLCVIKTYREELRVWGGLEIHVRKIAPCLHRADDAIEFKTLFAVSDLDNN